MTAVADDLTLALALAEVADAITLPRFRAVDLHVSTKPDATHVTEADTGAERAVRERLADARPGDAVLGEEYGGQGAGDGRRWIVDPIDGTANYVRGIPVWATLLALVDGGEPLVSVVSAPALGRRWWAARGQGAWAADGLGGQARRLAVSAVADLADAQVSLAGVAEWDAAPLRRDALFELAARVWRVRGFGDFWMHMLVAEGSADIAIDSPGVSLWDLAAPQLIVEEAGGRFTDLSGARGAAGGDAISSNGHLHDAVLAIVGRPVS